VQIQDGFESHCTYCIIPTARGGIRSKPLADVIDEVTRLTIGGCREIVLTGIETASYGADFRNGYRLGDLLSELDRRGSAERIRLGSLTPELMTEDFVEKIRSLPLLVPHFHLSMQSGSDGVLRRMKRRYNIKMAKEALARLREAIPRVEFTTDLMVGFPGESEEEFEETLAFVREARFLDIHVFAYSRRPNTPAATYEGQVPEEVKRERSAKLIALKNQIRDEILDDYIREGKTLSVVLEKRWDDGSYSSHSDSFVEVRVKVPTDRGDLHGEIVSATPVSHRDGVIIAELNKM
jgi:threonylcarbamoyladenosine tRNA methylthiotransferase MtaB